MTQEGGAGGLMVFLYAGGDMFFYAHLQSFTVDDGASVSQGQQVGTVGSSGNVDARVHQLGNVSDGWQLVLLQVRIQHDAAGRVDHPVLRETEAS